jgi:hypothetical protein
MATERYKVVLLGEAVSEDINGITI